ncbi:hypothetical protein V7654_12465 [Bacillus sp. JJ1609]|uniref:hypothetical protein n=1 Tax=Bacillus sp. JJ1609 TaxID=3122977 RepID=UPI002FFF5C7A
MNDYKYLIVQDGTLLKSDLEKKFKRYFTYRDIRSNNIGDYINFVGFIFTEEEALVSFPKHFFSEESLSKINRDNLNVDIYLDLLFKIIQKNISRENKRLLEVKQEINKGYPFEAFSAIYQYYQKYNLFTQERNNKKFGYSGKILWKDTFKKSPLVLNQGNLLYLPPVMQDRVSDFVFISKCMAYVINTTLDTFHFLFKLPLVSLEYRDINFSNKEKIINHLRDIKSHLFKDIHLRLIEDLITFFKNEHHGSKHYEIKIYSFHLIWEDMVRYYLNNHFSKINNETEEIIFNSRDNKKLNFQKREFELDSRKKNKGVKTYRIEPDYFLDEVDNRYIFDAKYYSELDKLDYKQVAYYFLLENFKNDKKLKIYNALFLPTSKSGFMKIHFHLDKEHSGVEEGFKIMEYYLNMREILQVYVGENTNIR